MNVSVNRHHNAPDLAALKTKQQAAWSSGDYAVVGTTLQIVGEELCEVLDLRSGQKALDVAAGNGNVSLPRRAAGATSFPPTMFRACSSAAAGGRRRRPDHRLQGGRRRGAAVRRRQLRRGGVDLRRDVHAQPGQGGARVAARLQVRRQDRSGPTGRRKVSSARCSRRSASTCRHRRAPNRRRCGARAAGSSKCSDRPPRRSRPSHAISSFAIGRRTISSICSRPTTVRC